MLVNQEDASVVSGLWDVAKAYSKGHARHKKFVQKLEKNGEWSRDMFYTNFEVSSLAFWRSEEYASFFRAIDLSEGIYRHRWGDAPIHHLAVSLLLPEARTHRFRDIGYWHQVCTLLWCWPWW